MIFPGGKKMNKIMVELGDRSYPIYSGSGILEQLPQLLQPVAANKQVAVISSPPVAGFYLEEITRMLEPGFNVQIYSVPDGESSKSLDQIEQIYSWLISNRFERGSTVLALGGGVIGDLAGFAAASFLRGINLVHLPTSLLAQVDSSIGGKVGVNHRLGKNLIGAFYQPRFVLADHALLATLPDEEFICGMGEVVKYGAIYDPELFADIEKHVDVLHQSESKYLPGIVGRCAAIKAEVVSKDEKEGGLRAILNFGHTFGHALEAYYEYGGLKHGQAVLLGMKCAAWVSGETGLADPESVTRFNQLVDRFDVRLPKHKPYPETDALIESMRLDKKVTGGRIKFILMEEIGQIRGVFLDDMQPVRAAFDRIIAQDAEKQQ
jgi:3-dehydroquinate synthase